jgi:CRP-like cAMP-binding protein
MATIELVTGKLEATVRRTTIEESQSKEKKAKEDQ